GPEGALRRALPGCVLGGVRQGGQRRALTPRRFFPSPSICWAVAARRPFLSVAPASIRHGISGDHPLASAHGSGRYQNLYKSLKIIGENTYAADLFGASSAACRTKSNTAGGRV